MNNDLFMKIVFNVKVYGTYFMCKKGCTGLWAFSSLQKCMAAMYCLACRAPLDATDDYLRMAESTCLQVLQGNGGGIWAKLFEGTQCR
jgi:hypothetical protein